jgi:hypothetical protein
MTPMKNLILLACLTGLLPLTFGQSKAPQRITTAEAKSHNGEMAVVCGQVVDSKISKYGISGRGRSVFLDMDQPEPTPVFYFVTFGPDPAKVASTYKGKQVCVTGKITTFQDVPFILVSEPAQLKIQAEGKK